MPDTNPMGQSAPVAAITVGVEVVVFTIRDDALHVLLAPADMAWGLPSDSVRAVETVDATARRALAAVAGSGDVWLEQLYTFGDVHRAPDQRTISIAHYALVSADVLTGGGTDGARWWPVATLPLLVLDHRRIFDYALARLRNKLEYTTVGFQLLPARFTLSELQRVYEVILGRELDKRNFRRKVELLGIVRPTREQRVTGSGRPAQLYRFVATEAPETIATPEPVPPTQVAVRIARMGPIVRRRGRIIPVAPAEGGRT